MNGGSIDVTGWGPLPFDEAITLQDTELARSCRLLASFDDDEWAAPTDCPGWDVRTMYQHVLGACEAASFVENARQMRAALRRRRRDGGPLEAALSATQIDARRGLTGAQLAERLAGVHERTVRRRRALPRPVRRIPLAVDGPVVERWTLGYLTGTIYLRDLWMHRVDACRATGRPVELTPAHDGRIVADVVAEWGRRHGRPFALELTGPAGGSFVGGDEGGRQAVGPLDAVALCRTLAGRVAGDGLLATVVPF